MEKTIRDVLGAYARLPVDISIIKDEDDLFQAGMTSHASVNVMLGLEEAFDVEFPEAMLTKSTFASVGSIAAALKELTRAEAVR